jgi:uncharacterized protein YigA (DUF484 family)
MIMIIRLPTDSLCARNTLDGLRRKNEELARTNSELSEELEDSTALANKNQAEAIRLAADQSKLAREAKTKEVN